MLPVWCLDERLLGFLLILLLNLFVFVASVQYIEIFCQCVHTFLDVDTTCISTLPHPDKIYVFYV